MARFSPSPRTRTLTDTDPVTDAATTASPPGPIAPHRPGRSLRVLAIVALVAVVVALFGLVLGTRPLRTPTQDCGTAFSFLLSGRQNVYVDPANPPKGVTERQAEANNATPCQERAANRSWPAGVLVVGGTLVAVVALLVDWFVRLRYRRAVKRFKAATPTA